MIVTRSVFLFFGLFCVACALGLASTLLFATDALLALGGGLVAGVAVAIMYFVPHTRQRRTPQGPAERTTAVAAGAFALAMALGAVATSVGIRDVLSLIGTFVGAVLGSTLVATAADEEAMVAATRARSSNDKA